MNIYELILFIVLVVALCIYIYYVLIFYSNSEVNNLFCISLTTTPKRINKIKPVLDSLINQSYKNRIIILNLPELFRNKEKYIIPEWLKNYPIIINYIPKDYGPITKCAGLLHMNKKKILNQINKYFPYLLYKEFFLNDDYYIIYLDDDVYYNKNVVNFCNKNCEKDKILTCSINNDFDNLKIIEGFSAVCFYRKLLENDFINFIEERINNIDCLLSDDMIISQYFNKKNIEIMYINNILAGYNRSLFLLNAYRYGLESDALHKGADGFTENDNHCFKYKRCFNYLNNL